MHNINVKCVYLSVKHGVTKKYFMPKKCFEVFHVHLHLFACENAEISCYEHNFK